MCFWTRKPADESPPFDLHAFMLQMLKHGIRWRDLEPAMLMKVYRETSITSGVWLDIDHELRRRLANGRGKKDV